MNKKHVALAAAAATTVVGGFVAGKIINKPKAEKTAEIEKKIYAATVMVDEIMGYDVWNGDSDPETAIHDKVTELKQKIEIRKKSDPIYAEELRDEMKDLTDALKVLKAHDALKR